MSNNIQFTENEFYSFLKYYVIKSNLKPNENTVEIFQKFLEIEDYQTLLNMVKYILFHFIPNEDLDNKAKMQILLYNKNLIHSFFKYEKDYKDYKIINELNLNLYDFIIKSNFCSTQKLFQIILDTFHILIYQLNEEQSDKFLDQFFIDINDLEKLTSKKSSEIIQILKLFMKNKKIKFNQKKINSLQIILEGILNFILNNLKVYNEGIFIDNINLFISLLDLTNLGIKNNFFYEIYQNENKYFSLLIKSNLNILEKIDLQIKNENLELVINVMKFKRKILKFLIIIFQIDPYSFPYLMELFKFFLIYLNNCINCENSNDKLKNLGIEENRDIFLQYIKVILVFILIVLKQRKNNILKFFKDSAFDFIEKILLIFINIELSKIESFDLIKEFDMEEEKESKDNLNKITFDKSIFSYSLLLIKELCQIYPFIFEQICNFALGLIESHKSYIGYYLIIQLAHIKPNLLNIDDYIMNNIDKILSVSYNKNIQYSKIIVYQIINFLFSFHNIIIHNNEIYIKCLYYIYNNLNCFSVPIRKNSSIKLCLMIKEINLKNDNNLNNLKSLINEISNDLVNKLFNNGYEEYIDFFHNGLDNCIFENSQDFLFNLFNSITKRINNEFNDNKCSEKVISDCFNLLIKIFKNKIYNSTLSNFINDALNFFLNNVIGLLNFVQKNNFDEQIFEILYLFLNQNINLLQKNKIYENLKYIPSYVKKNNFVSTEIYNLLNLIIEKESKEVQSKYLQDVFLKILQFKYKVNEDSSVIKICILLQCLVYSNDSLSDDFIYNSSNFAFNKILNSISNPNLFYYYYTIFSLMSFVFSLFKNYSQIIMNVINSNNNLLSFYAKAKSYIENDFNFNILQAKFNVFLLCDIINENYYKQSSILFLDLCYSLIMQIILQEKRQNIKLEKILLKTYFVKSDEDNNNNEYDEEEFDNIDLGEINKLFLNEINLISKIKNEDEFKKFSQCFYSFYNKNKNIVEKEFLMSMNDKEKKFFINLLHTHRIEFQNFNTEKINTQFKYNENGGIPRKIIKIKRNNNINNNNNTQNNNENQMEI